MDPSVSQAKLSLFANPKQNAMDFDVCFEYFRNQASLKQANQYLNIAAVGPVGTLKTKTDKGQNLKMPVKHYSNEQWAQLFSEQKASVRKCHASNRGGRWVCDFKSQHAIQKKGSDEHMTLAVSVLTNNVNIMVVKMG